MSRPVVRPLRRREPSLKGDRAGEVFDVSVPTYVAAIFDFERGAIANTTFSFDSPLTRVGVVEIAGTEATLAGPDPNYFGGDIRIIRTGDEEWDVIPVTGVEGGRGIGVVDMARALRNGGKHRATGRLALHVLDAMLATAESIEQQAFVEVDSRVDPIAGASRRLGPHPTHPCDHPPLPCATRARGRGACRAVRRRSRRGRPLPPPR